MQIILNGEVRQVPAGCSAADLLASLALGERRVAMEVNLEILPRSQYEHYRFAEGDRVEVVQAIGGG